MRILVEFCEFFMAFEMGGVGRYGRFVGLLYDFIGLTYVSC